ncbi:MAG: S-layer homology domain-containing protein [Chloroflexia bacterium]
MSRVYAYYGLAVAVITLLIVLVAASSALGADLNPQRSTPSAVRALRAESTVVIDSVRKLPPSPGEVEQAPPDPDYRSQVCLAPVVNVSQRTGNESESFVVINPTNPNNIVAFSNLSPGGSSIFRGYSTDGGVTWTRGTVATGVACCDGQAAFDMFGNLFLVYLNNGASQVNVILSIDGGATFSAPVNAGVGSVDQPSIAVGNGSVWVDWNVSGNMMARGAPVTGLGTWGPFNTAQTIPSGNGSFGGIAVGPGPNGGKVMVTYLTPYNGQGPANIYVNVDVDGLGSGLFGPRILASTTNVGGFDYIPAQARRSVDAESGLVWDSTGGPFNDRVYLVYTEETVNENNDTEIYVRTSTNNGTTWTAPTRVNDDLLGLIRSQFNPYITLDRTSGVVAVGWHDARNDNGVPGVGGTNTIPNDDAEYYASYSVDGGLTWAANTRLRGGFSNSAASGNGIDYGDYTGQDAYGGKFVAVWADNANCDGTNPNGTLSAFDLYVGTMTIPGQGTPTPTVTGTITVISTVTRTSTAIPTTTNTITVLPTATSTNTLIPTSTMAASPTATNTSTPEPPTATSTATATSTEVATLTSTATDTSVPSATPTSCPIEFKDVPASNTFYENVRCLACKGIVSGYSDGTFRPNNQVTRGQLAKMVSNAAGFSEPVSGQTFQDVPPTHTFYEFIERLTTRGYMTGYNCGGPGEPCINNMPYFRPQANATRGQTSKIVANAAIYTEPPVGQTFQDVPPTHTFYAEIQRLASRNVMQGYACGGAFEPCVGTENKPYFRPGNDVTRGQSAKIVANTFYPNCQTP